MLDNNIGLTSSTSHWYRSPDGSTLRLHVEYMRPPYTELTVRINEGDSNVFARTFRGVDFRVGKLGLSQSVVFLRLLIESHMKTMDSSHFFRIPGQLISLDNVATKTDKINNIISNIQSNKTTNIEGIGIRLKNQQQGYDIWLQVPKLIQKTKVDHNLFSELVDSKYKDVETKDLLRHLEDYLLKKGSPII